MNSARNAILLALAALLILTGCWLPERKMWTEQQERLDHIREHLLVPGEKLTYEIRGGIFELGQAELSMKVSEKNSEDYEVALFANSTHPWFPSFSYSYKSTVNKNDFSTALFELEEMKKSEIKKSITFRPDYSTRKAEYEYVKRRGTKRGMIAIDGRIYDYVSLIYLLRKDLPEVGKFKEVSLFNETEVVNIRVKNLAKRELVLDNVGKFRAFVLKPKRRFEGIFFERGDITLWIDETFLIPLRIVIKMPFGVGRIDLKKAENMQTGEIFIQ